MKFGRWMALLAALMVSFAVRAHGSWQEHVADMTEVMGLREEPRLRAWMKFISSDMIDKCEPFYSELKARHEGFACKHRLLFHWGYDAEPWSPELEARVVRYCREYDLDRDSTLRLFRSEMVAEQKRRNALLNRRTEELFGFAHGGRGLQRPSGGGLHLGQPRFGGAAEPRPRRAVALPRASGFGPRGGQAAGQGP